MYHKKMEVVKYIWKHKSLLILIIVYAFLSLSFIVGNGEYNCLQGVCGLHIGNWHLHDAMWHLALVKMSFNQFPFIHPEMSGAYLNGYNYLLDLVIFGLTKLGLPALFVFFKLLPILFIPLYAYLLIRFARAQRDSFVHVWWLLFFMFFGSSFTYLVTLFRAHTLYYAAIKGFPVVTSIQPGLIFLNLQFAYSLLACLGIMLLIDRKHGWKQNILIGILVFVATSLKFYGGVVAMSLIGIYELLSVWEHKKITTTLSNIVLPSCFFLVSILLFYKSSGQSLASPFAFAPLAMVHVMIEDPNMFYNHDLTNARYFLYQHGGFSPRLIAIETYSIMLFLLVNYGTRLLFLLYLPIKILQKKFSRLQIAMLVTIMLTTLMPILFVQDGGWFNTMQFLYYGVFLSSFFAAEALATLVQNKKRIFLILAIVVIALTIPNDIEQLRYIAAPLVVIPQGELDALNFLAKAPKGVVFTSYAHKKTAYISALSGQQTWFVDVDQLMVTHTDYVEREKLVLRPWLIDPEAIDATYWYIVKKGDGAAEEYNTYTEKLQGLSNFKLIFSNDTVDLYQKD